MNPHPGRHPVPLWLPLPAQTPPLAMPHDIFISYSRRDLAAVKPIKEELESLGFSCWMDLEGIESGSPEFTEAIAEAIGGSTAVLFFLSTASQASRWSLNELRVARDEGKHVVLVRFNDARMTAKFKLEFGGTDVIDWRVPEQSEKLLRDLRRWTRRGTPSPNREKSSKKTVQSRATRAKAEPSRRSRARSSSAAREGPCPRTPPISIEFKYDCKVLGCKLYRLDVTNKGSWPVDILIAVRNGAKHLTFRQIMKGCSTESFRFLGGRWRFTHGDRGIIKAVGYSEPIRFGLDADGYWPAS